MGLLERFRKWLDADYQEGTVHEESRPRNRSEEFLVSVAREVEKVMRAEMFTPPGGPTYIPRTYIIFLSPDDDAEWRGEKRKGLEQGLFHVLSEHAAAIVGERESLQTNSFAVELRVDGSLAAGKFRVQAVWDAEAEKTMVRPRRAAAAAAAGAAGELDDDATLVRPRHLFSLTVNHEGNEQTYKFTKPLITIGRAARKHQVDLPLEGDMEISRHQATIELADGHFQIKCEGRNSIFVDGVELVTGQTAAVAPGQRIEIATFSIQLQKN